MLSWRTEEVGECERRGGLTAPKVHVRTHPRPSLVVLVPTLRVTSLSIRLRVSHSDFYPVTLHFCGWSTLGPLASVVTVSLRLNYLVVVSTVFYPSGRPRRTVCLRLGSLSVHNSSPFSLVMSTIRLVCRETPLETLDPEILVLLSTLPTP